MVHLRGLGGDGHATDAAEVRHRRQHPAREGLPPHGGEADDHAAGIPSTSEASVRTMGQPHDLGACELAVHRAWPPLGIASTSGCRRSFEGRRFVESRGRFRRIEVEDRRPRLLYVGCSLDIRMYRRGAIPTNGWKLALSVAVRRQARDGPQPAPRASPGARQPCGLATARRPALRVPRPSPRARRGRPRRG
jgi:hypothetical protein